MREIKFRGKRFDNNHDDWIYGHLHVIDTCGDGYTGKAIQQQCGTSRPYSVQVYSESVGQYTELRDKNDKEIYDGDIVRVHEGEDFTWDHEVEYWHGGFWVTDENIIGAIHTFCEVIGNVHENPEFVE